MVSTVNPQFAATVSPPVMEARRWLEGTRRTCADELLNMSQAAPVAAPPENLRAAMSEFLLNEAEAHIYGPVLGNPELRREIDALMAQLTLD
jgi:aspartate/methionine/tyrosine aminotransferase